LYKEEAKKSMDREKGILVARSGVRIPGATQGF
jgi:hypothetical protein